METGRRVDEVEESEEIGVKGRRGARSERGKEVRGGSGRDERGKTRGNRLEWR